MKAVLLCLIVVLACSCRDSRHDEVLKIMRDTDIRSIENGANWLTAEERDELRRLKQDYYAEVRNRRVHPTLVIPGRGWEIRGPLTIPWLEQESADQAAGSGRQDIPPGRLDAWVGLKVRYKDGDELYFYRSDQRSWSDLCGAEGYVLIRGNQEVGRTVTKMN